VSALLRTHHHRREADTYDTVAALWREAPRVVVDAIEWTDERKHRTEDGEVLASLRSSGRGGPAFLLHPDGTLKVERSLPKALTGQNAVDLTQSDVGDALDAVGREIWEATGRYRDVLDFGEWDPCRVDYCRSLPSTDPALVSLTLARLAGVNMKRKGYPVVGESGSVAWTRGMFRFKAYNKGRETAQDDLLGVLRLEGSASGGRALSVIPGLLGPAHGARRDQDQETATVGMAARRAAERWERGSTGGLAVVDVLVPAAHEFVLSRFLAQIGGYMPTTKDVGEVELLRAMVEFFGARRAFGLLGVCAGWAMLGISSASELERLGLGEGTTWYRARADLRRFREAMAARGDDPGSLEELQARVGRLVTAA